MEEYADARREILIAREVIRSPFQDEELGVSNAEEAEEEVEEVEAVKRLEATKASEIGALKNPNEPKASEVVETLPFLQNTGDSDDEFSSVASYFSMNTFHTAASRINNKHNFKMSLPLQRLVLYICNGLQIAEYQIDTAIMRKPWRGRISGLSTLLSSKIGPGVVSMWNSTKEKGKKSMRYSNHKNSLEGVATR